jgi:hypothetical protein
MKTGITIMNNAQLLWSTEPENQSTPQNPISPGPETNNIEPALWSKETEINFFLSALNLTTPDTLFYKTPNGRYYAYWPKTYRDNKSTLQSRNAYIGNFTEKFCVELLSSYATPNKLFAVQSVVCKEIGLIPSSPADIAICKTTARHQSPENIIAIFEAKMSNCMELGINSKARW